MIITPTSLAGVLPAPPSKSMAHRVLIAALLAEEESVVSGVQLCDDIAATLEAIRILGARVRVEPEGLDRVCLYIRGGGRGPLDAVIHCGESGSTLRFMVPVALALGGRITFEGGGRLPERPMEPYLRIFDRQKISYHTPDGLSLPLRLEGRLRPDRFRLPGNVSSQFITGLMLALPLLSGDSVLEVEGTLESGSYVELTASVLTDFGITIERLDHPGSFSIPGGQRYRPARYAVEGDWSQAAFLLTAGVLGGDIRVDGLRMDSAQGDRVIVDILRSMGGDITEESGGLRARQSELRGRDVNVSQCPDLAPAVAAALALSSGGGHITGAGRLRLKESDRIAAIAAVLNALGADIREQADGMDIRGVPSLKGGSADSFGDHRIAMMAACVSSRCADTVRLTGTDAVSKSYPGFWEDMERLGGRLQ